MRWLLLLVACTVPDLHSGNLQCASGRVCPDGFHCAADDRCWKDGSDPDLAVMEADLAALPDLGTVDLSHPRDAAMADAAIDASVGSKCATSKALLCDGFEMAALDPEWSITGMNGTVAVDQTRFYRGGRSLYLHTGQVPDGGSAQATVEETRTFPQNGATLYLRAWIYVQSPYPAEAFDQFVNFVDAAFAGIAYVWFNGLPLLNAYTTPNVFKVGTQPAIPLDRWFCLQMSVPQTGATGTVHLSIDGVDSDATSAGVATPSMVGVHLGLQFNGGGAGFGPADVWVDEVIVDTSAISCND